MFLGMDKLQELVKEVRLVEDLSERELENLEGSGFDLRVGKISAFTDNGNSSLLSIDERKTLASNVIADIAQGEQILDIKPGQYVLVTTVERVNTPAYLLGIIRPRGTLFRSGIILIIGEVSPGYNSELTFGMCNASPFSFSLQLGARVAHVLFAYTDGVAVPYRGQWQNGRIST